MNPELQRNLQLDATPRKLAVSGAVLAGVFAAVWLVDRGRHASAVTLAGGAVFAAACLGGAPRAARRAVTGEVAAGSWDFQRLSAMTPAAMTWGKLAGATARPWALGGGGLLLAWLQLASTAGARRASAWLVVALALAITLQAGGLATGLIDIRRARASGRPPSRRAPALVLVGLALLALAALFAVRAWIGQAVTRLGLLPGGPSPPPLVWFGQGYRPAGFAAATLLALAAWAVVWAWRLMRMELQHQNAPVAWPAFLACAGLYAFGFAPAGAGEQHPLAARLAAAAAVWAVLAYLAAFIDPADRVRARQFAGAVRGREIVRALSRLPLVVAPGCLALAAGVLVAALRAHDGAGAGALAVLAGLALFGRDLGVIAWRRLAGRGGGDRAVLLALLALYTLAPALAWLPARARGLALFWPSPAHPRLSPCAALVEAALAWALAAFTLARPAAPRPPRPRPAPQPPQRQPTSVPPTPAPAGAATGEPQPGRPWR